MYLRCIASASIVLVKLEYLVHLVHLWCIAGVASNASGFPERLVVQLSSGASVSNELLVQH